MATAKPDPAGQDHPLAPSVPGSRSLDTLQSMLNLVFLTTGRFAKEHHAGGGTGRMKLAMQRNVPVAADRFHDALDEMENEVRQAQAVLRRDLALMKQDRRRREAAAKQQELERARLAAESRQSMSLHKSDVVVKAEPTTPPHVETSATNNQPAESAEPAGTLKREEENVPPPTAAATATNSAPPTDAPLNASTVDNPPDTEFDFDAIFGDEMDTSGGGDGHNQNTNTNNQDDTKMDTSADLNFTTDEGPSLLRGLEEFAKSSDDDTAGPSTNMDIDFSMSDLPQLNAANTSAPTEPPAVTKPVEKPATQPPPPPATTTTTTTTTTTATITTTNNTDLLVADNLDDLFNMDEYENPENSSFADAFFDFDN